MQVNCPNRSARRIIDLRDIKKMMLSSNKEQVSLAASNILAQMNDAEQVIEMIDSDIPEFLCDAMVPLDSYISGTIYNCLAAMTKYENFFSQNHSSVAFETVIRSLYFHVKNYAHDTGMRQPMNVLLMVLEGYSKYNVFLEKKPYENLINLLLIILSQANVSHEVSHLTGLILKTVFVMELWKIHPMPNYVELCDKWFQSLCTKSEREGAGQLTGETLSLGCVMCEQTLRFLKNVDELEEDLPTCSQSETENREKLIRNIIKFIIEQVAPRISESPPGKEKGEIERLEHFFASVVYLFRETVQVRYQVAQKLTEMGQSDNLKMLSLMSLFEIILSLSEEVFTFPEMWPSGRDHFRREILAGVSNLPRDSSTWMDGVLGNSDADPSSRFALVIYLYFHFLTVKIQHRVEYVNASIAKFLESAVRVNSPPMLIKAVWFVFVMSEMTTDSDSAEPMRDWTLKKMLEVLEGQKDFGSIYTHHPALLYWAFSSPQITFRVQCEVVKLWLERRSPECTVLDDFAAKSADVRLTILQLLQNGYEHVAHLAFSTLKAILLRSDDVTLACSIWFMLPQLLAKYTTDLSTAVKVDYILELATIKTPDRPDMSKVVRIAGLLPEALDKSDLLSLSSVLKLAHQLLEISVENDDSRVLFTFLRSESFVKRVMLGFECDTNEVVVLSVKITTILWTHRQSEPLRLHWYKRMTLDACTFLKILNSTDAELVKSGLILVDEILTTEFKSTIVDIRGISPEFLAVLFFDLENALIRFLPIITDRGWICLRKCLCLSEGLRQDVLLHELIRLALPTLPDSSEMVSFLVTWFGKCVALDRNLSRNTRDRESYFLETVHRVASFVADNNMSDLDDLIEKVLDCCKRYSIDATEDPFKTIASYKTTFDQ